LVKNFISSILVNCLSVLLSYQHTNYYICCSLRCTVYFAILIAQQLYTSFSTLCALADTWSLSQTEVSICVYLYVICITRAKKSVCAIFALIPHTEVPAWVSTVYVHYLHCSLNRKCLHVFWNCVTLRIVTYIYAVYRPFCTVTLINVR
jgi:hypothetical protein